MKNSHGNVDDYNGEQSDTHKPNLAGICIDFGHDIREYKKYNNENQCCQESWLRSKFMPQKGINEQK